MQHYELTQPFTPIQLTLFYRVNTKAITYCFCLLDFEDKNLLLITKKTADTIIELVNKEFNKQFQPAPFNVTINQLLAHLIPLEQDTLILGKIGYSLLLDRTSDRSKAKRQAQSQIIYSNTPTHSMNNSIIFFD